MSLKKKMALAALALAAGSAFATPVTAHYTSFGALSAATFGGSGIPNSDVAITSLGAGQPILGLTATQRYSNPAVVSHDNGVFQAVTGAYAAGDNLARWNFDYYVGGSNVGSYSYRLLADFDAGANTDESKYVDISLVSGLSFGVRQNSLNLGDLLASASNSFDPSKNGEYGFILEAWQGGREVGRSAILVDVGNVPEPTSLALVGVALAGAAFAARRRKA